MFRDSVIEPYLMPERIFGPNYNTFIDGSLSELLEGVCLDTGQDMQYQAWRVPTHYGNHFHELFNATFQGT
jgi:hypothetical protein